MTFLNGILFGRNFDMTVIPILRNLSAVCSFACFNTNTTHRESSDVSVKFLNNLWRHAMNLLI